MLIVLIISVCAVSVLRIICLSNVRQQADTAGNAEEAVFLGAVEVTMAIISISLPSLRPLPLRCRERWHHRRSRSGGPTASPSSEMPPIEQKPSHGNDDTLASYRDHMAGLPSNVSESRRG